MATKKISELEAISEAASDDVLAIVDVSETETRKITKGNLLVGAGHTIEMSLNSTTYTLTLSLKNEAGTVLNTQTVDLPNENALTNITYSNGILTLTKQNGATSTVDISGLISGLLSETTFNAFVTEIGEIIGISTDTYRTTSIYNTGDIVIYNGKIYKCNNNNVTGTFDDTKWDEISLYEYQKLQDQKIENKVEKENGKGLSTNDYTTAEKNKLSGIETGAEVNIIETVKVNGTALTPTDKEVNVPVPTKTSDLNNDSNFGTYTKPTGGIPKTDLSSDIQVSLNVESKTDYIFDSSTTNYQPVINKIIDTSGAEQASTNYGYYEISVNPGEIYVIYVSYSSNGFGTNKVRYMFKNNNTVVSYTTGETTPERTNNYYTEIINIPTGVDKLLINCGDVGQTYSKNYINKITKYHQNNIARNYLDSKLQSFFTDIYTEVQPEVYIENAYMNDSNNILSYSTAKLYALAVTPNTKYKITAKQLYGNPLIFITNNNSNYTRTFNNVDYSFEACSIKIKNSTSGYQYTDYEFTVPEYCEKIYINKMNSDSAFLIKKQTDYKLSACNPLKNKILCFTGDSIMAASPQGVKGWVGIMKENNPEASFYNYAHDGYTIAKAEDEWSTRSIQNTLETMLNEHSNADYIVIQGGANDYWGSEHGITLGEISSGFNTNDFDRTTFSGGLEYIFNYCYSNFPGAKVGFVVTHQVYASNFYQFMDRAKEICKKWAVPYIDLFTEGNLNFQISYMRENYSRIDSSHPSGDGLHPNLAGYEIETPKIENWLKYKL